MFAFALAVLLGPAPLQSDTEARRLAGVAVAQMGYATPDAEMKVRRARSAPDRPFSLVEWAGFRLEILDSGVLRYFKRESGAYRLSGAPIQYEDAESARVGLARVAITMRLDGWSEPAKAGSSSGTSTTRWGTGRRWRSLERVRSRTITTRSTG